MTSPAGRGVHNGRLLLVNAEHPFRGEPGGLIPVGEDGILLERRAAALLGQLLTDIHGWQSIALVSGWRSREEQQTLWDGSVRDHGAAFTRRYVAAPGCSEHETGLAVDLGLRTEPLDSIRPSFPYTGVCQTFRERAARYGFIQRYPADKTPVTGIAHEPWHFRYVGTPHAAIMTERGLTLEEYIVFLRQYPAGRRPFLYESGRHRFSIAYWPADGGRETPSAGERGACMLSGDNVDGFIVTRWNGEGDDVYM